MRKSYRAVFVVRERGGKNVLLDPVTGEAVGEAAGGELTKVKVNNGLRRTIREALAALTLGSPNAEVRKQAAETMFSAPDAGAIEALDAAITKETDASAREAMVQARAAAVLASDLSEDERLDAIEAIGARGDRAALSLLTGYEAWAEGAPKEAAAEAIAGIRNTLAAWNAAQNVWYGVSLGSVLLLAAIGLAITFGVMGVINMAHGEMVMLGAYTTFVVQDVIRASILPALFGGRAGRDEARIDEILETVRLADRRGDLAAALSHGQKQWLEIGMLLAQDPKLLLVDEPVAGMTDAETEETAPLLKDIAKTHSLIVVEHDMHFVRELGVKVTCLHEGSVLSEGPLDFVSAGERVIEVYLGR